MNFKIYYSQTAKDRFTSEEKRALDRANTDLYQEVRLAAEAHRQVKQHIFMAEAFRFAFVLPSIRLFLSLIVTKEEIWGHLCRIDTFLVKIVIYSYA